MQSCGFPTAQDLSLSKVRVAADYSDSVPDSPKYMGVHGYHPLEELRDHGKKKDLLLTDAEIARTTVEANTNALLIFPGGVHCEPHGHVSWSEFQYVIDDYGDIFFEFYDDESILQDPRAINPVTVRIDMDNSIPGDTRWITGNYNEILDSSIDDDDDDDDDYDDDEIDNTEVTDTLIKWGMPETLRQIHPLYFAKSLTKSVHAKYRRKMDLPSNGLSMVGFLRPAFLDEESYLRSLFHHEDGDGYSSEWKDEADEEEEKVDGNFDLIDGEILRLSSDGDKGSSTLYKFEIMSMELFSVYGDQSMVSLQAFQDAEPDVLAHSASAIIERIHEYGTQGNAALKALCRKKKGLIVERANLIGVDSLGMDVRTSSGLEAQTLRFSFNTRALSESAAEKKIKRMLFPRYHRKNPRIPADGVRDLTSY